MGMQLLAFNKACEVEDFAHPDLVATIDELHAHRRQELPQGFPSGHEDRRDWEAAMSLRSLRAFGAVTAGATLLGVAAGHSDLPFHLARQVRQVFAVDRYLDMAGTRPESALWRVIHPEDFSPFPVDRTRLVIQHMDPRWLCFPDDTFDGVFCGRTTGLRGLQDAGHAAFEMGRVLKLGGVLSMAVELRLAGPPGATGFPADLVLSPDHVERFVVAASGLQPVDEVRLLPSPQTLEMKRDLAFSTLHRPADASAVRRDYPGLVVLRDGYVSTSAHLTLAKTAGYPCVANGWAEPPIGTADRVSGCDRAVLGRQ